MLMDLMNYYSKPSSNAWISSLSLVNFRFVEVLWMCFPSVTITPIGSNFLRIPLRASANLILKLSYP